MYALPYQDMLPVDATIWAPGTWLYATDSAAILEPLLRPPIAPGKVAVRSVNELREGEQRIGAFTVRASG